MTRWKFDVDPNDPLVLQRIPVTSRWPVMPYLAAFDKESKHRPTLQEALMLSSFSEMIKTFGFSVTEQQGMDGEAFDFHPRATTVVFHKYQRDDWGHRRANSMMAGFAPPSPRVRGRVLGPLSLLRVMDLYWSDPFAGVDDRWVKWKETHAEAFGKAEEGTETT